jgi:hypothetical protein
MANTADLTPHTLKVLLVGDAGTKKTILASTFPDPHFVDLDGGMLSVRGKNVKYITIGEKETTDPDFLAIYKLNAEKKAKQSMFLKAQDLIEYWANTLTAQQTLVIDSLTFYSEAALNHVQKLENNKDARQTYMGAQKLISTTFELLKHLECNVIVTAHRTMVEETEGVISYVPKTAGKSFALALPSYFDEVWRTSVKTAKVKGAQGEKSITQQVFALETIKGLREQGKSRLNLPPVVEEPTYEKIMALAKNI